MDFINSIRVPGDKLFDGSHNSAPSNLDKFVFNDLLVQQSVVPKIAEQIELISHRLRVDPSSIVVFVFASPYIQAECRIDEKSRCLLRISSALIESFSEDELNYVIGHEIGHFQLGHLHQNFSGADKSVEGLLISRRRELSADRVGFIACQSLTAALSAMMKTVSGLSDRFLKLDITSFIHQVREFSISPYRNEQILGTHPAFMIRCRALLWFSMLDILENQGINYIDQCELDKTNKRVVADLEKYIDASAIDSIKDAELSYLFWSKALLTAQKGVLTKKDQQDLINEFGSELTTQLKSLLVTLNNNEAIEELELRANNCRNELINLAPFRFSEISN